jgi:hypothetical protein
MPRPRKLPNPLAAKRLELERQERELAERMAQLHHELHGAETPPEPELPPPPVWRLEDAHDDETPELASAKRRALARHRRRDMIIFFIFVGVLALASAFFLWIWYAHAAEAPPGP